MAGSMAASLGKDNPYRFKGYYYDEETGMYYLKSRYYQPEICRFISADTTDVLEIQEDLDDLNLYTYCNNNPINWEDPDGTIAIELGYVALTVLVFTYVYIAGVRRKKKTTRTYTVTKSYWNSHSHSNYLGNKIISFSAYTVTKWVSGKTKNSKGGKQNIKDSGLAGLSDAEVSRRAKDKSLSKKERDRYKKEEKARALRNKRKRKSHY